MSEKIKKDRREFLAQAGALVVGSLVAGNAMGLTAKTVKTNAKATGTRNTALIKEMIAKKGFVSPHPEVKQLTSPFSNVVVERSSLMAGDVEVLADVKTMAATIQIDITAGKYDVASVAAVLEDMAALMQGAVVNAEEGGGDNCGGDCGGGCATGGGGDGCGEDCGETGGNGCGNGCPGGGGETGSDCGGGSGGTNCDHQGRGCGNGCGNGCGKKCNPIQTEGLTGYDSFLQEFIFDLHGLDFYTIEMIKYNRTMIMLELVAL